MTRVHVFHTVRMRSGWVLKEGGEVISTHHNQLAGWAAAVLACRTSCLKGVRAKAVLHRKDGSVREERLYEHVHSSMDDEEGRQVDH